MFIIFRGKEELDLDDFDDDWTMRDLNLDDDLSQLARRVRSRTLKKEAEDAERSDDANAPDAVEEVGGGGGRGVPKCEEHIDESDAK